MSTLKTRLLTAGAAVALGSLLATLPVTSNSATARGWSDHDRSHQTYRAKRYSKRKARRSYRRYRPRAVYSYEVDLKRPGGVSRYFELLQQESR